MQGLSSTKVRLETLETEKAQKAAAATEALLPALVRMLDYVIVHTLVATLGDDLARLRALLEQCGVLKVCVELQGGSVALTPNEAVVAHAIGKQVRHFNSFLFARQVIMICSLISALACEQHAIGPVSSAHFTLCRKGSALVSHSGLHAGARELCAHHKKGRAPQWPRGPLRPAAAA